MQFSVIYTIDVNSEADLKDFLPSHEIHEKMDETEGDDQYEYDYLGGVWESGKHTKIVGILSEPEFKQFIEETELIAQEVETGGSIGAPGYGYGWAPAISFEPDRHVAEHDSIRSAYVTPMPENDEESTAMEARGWDGVKEDILSCYGEDAA